MAFILLKYLTIKLEGKTESELEGFFVSYDNICNLARLKLLKNPLPLEAPMDNLWTSINKIIDDLHIKNHRREECQELYNPSIVREVFPDVNLMTAEQVITIVITRTQVRELGPRDRSLLWSSLICPGLSWSWCGPVRSGLVCDEVMK